MAAGDAIRLGASATNIVFLTHPRKPISGIPVGAKARLRIRSGTLPTIAVRTRQGIARYYLRDIGDSWAPAFNLGAIEENETIPTVPIP